MSDYFNYETDPMLACSCCGEKGMDEEFLVDLDEAREMAGIPFKISSGYRCKKHNKAVGGKANSAHTKGLAVDIKCHDSDTRYKILEALFVIGFERIGVSDNFIHVDNDLSLPNPRTWLY